jgi:hypothetical protein
MLILPTASLILFQAVSPGTVASGARLDMAYLEFVNGPSVEPPDIHPAESTGYYDRLNSTSDRDYLRCPILSHVVKQDTDGRGILTLVIVSDGETGVHGKPFSAGAGSRVYGLALAASQTNRRGDLLFARHYYDRSDQVEKPEHGGIMLSFDLILT